MNALTVQTESWLRLGAFLTLFSLLALLEVLYPRRQLLHGRLIRWPTNLLLSALNTTLARVVVPIAGVGAALLADRQGMGLFNWLSLPAWLELIVFLLLFDLTIYLQHRVFHRVPVLWRLHRMHHTDPDYDLTTGNRFHPLSILLSGLIKVVLILLVGPMTLAVVIGEILLNSTSMFNHSNIRIPSSLDSRLRLLVVTPDMHRVHHSINELEHNRNFGFNFPWWDRLFGTYQEQPTAGHEKMEIGIRGFHGADTTRLLPLLVQPLKK